MARALSARGVPFIQAAGEFRHLGAELADLRLHGGAVLKRRNAAFECLRFARLWSWFAVAALAAIQEPL